MLTDEEKRKIRLMKNEYARNWRKQNPEKVKAIHERFWKKKLLENQEQKEIQ